MGNVIFPKMLKIINSIICLIFFFSLSVLVFILQRVLLNAYTGEPAIYLGRYIFYWEIVPAGKFTEQNNYQNFSFCLISRD